MSDMTPTVGTHSDLPTPVPTHLDVENRAHAWWVLLTVNGAAPDEHEMTFAVLAATLGDIRDGARNMTDYDRTAAMSRMADTGDIGTRFVALADAIAATNAANAGTLAIGHDDGLDDDTRRICRTWVVAMVAGRDVERTPTVWQLVRYWQERHDIVRADLVAIERGLRAGARAQSWEDRYSEVMADVMDSLVWPTWRETTENPAPSMSGDIMGADIIDPAITRPVDHRDLWHDNAKVIARRIHRVDVTAHADIEHVLQRTVEMADARGWCGDYERNIERIARNIIDEIMRAVFMEAANRERDYLVYGSAQVEVTITISVPISEVVTARNEDHASELATFDDIDVDEWSVSEALGMSRETLRGMSWDYDIRSADVEHVEYA
jgi:hypothetical protein